MQGKLLVVELNASLKAIPIGLRVLKNELRQLKQMPQSCDLP